MKQSVKLSLSQKILTWFSLYRILPKLRRPWFGGISETPRFAPHDPWPGSTERGRSMLAGLFTLRGEQVRFGRNCWSPAKASPQLLTALHDFDWLRDLDATGDKNALNYMQVMVEDWLHCAPHFPADIARFSARVDVTGHRLFMLLAWYPRLTEGNSRLARLLWQSLAEQGMQLRQSRLLPVPDLSQEGRIRPIVPGVAMMRAIAGLVAFELCLAKPSTAVKSKADIISGKDSEKTVQLLTERLPLLYHPDGGHVSRSPQAQAEILRHLVSCRDVFRQARLPIPEALQNALDRMAPALRFFRHGDGGLALFHDSVSGDGSWIDLILAQSQSFGAAPRSLPHSGYERLAAENTVVLMDCAAPPPPEAHPFGHASCFAIEVSIGRERVITNCGAWFAPHAEWWQAARRSAAHSTLTLEDQDNAEFREGGRIGRRPTLTERHRNENEQGIWVEASHDFYQIKYGAIHQRRLFLASNGIDLRGEDILHGSQAHYFALRFHLHPLVEVSLAVDKNCAYLRLASGAIWQFRSAGGNLNDSETV
ncbi:MAG: heparinase II/III family protein, partial [Alphaproteobacteria bacterium]|nr:heparinase II/III family protein [Alphaproteobacteria bacterium]